MIMLKIGIIIEPEQKNWYRRLYGYYTELDKSTRVHQPYFMAPMPSTADNLAVRSYLPRETTILATVAVRASHSCDREEHKHRDIVHEQHTTFL